MARRAEGWSEGNWVSLLSEPPPHGGSSFFCRGGFIILLLTEEARLKVDAPSSIAPAWRRKVPRIFIYSFHDKLLAVYQRPDTASMGNTR